MRLTGRVLVPMLLSLTACDGSKSPAWPVFTCAQLEKPDDAVRKLCFDTLDPEPHCSIPYSAPQRITGTWLVGFETSAFFPKGVKPDFGIKHCCDTALMVSSKLENSSAADQVKIIRAGAIQDKPQLISIDAIGRRSLCRFAYGHAASPHGVIIDKFLTVKLLKPS
jgi:hypothetical protein